MKPYPASNATAVADRPAIARATPDRSRAYGWPSGHRGRQAVGALAVAVLAVLLTAGPAHAHDNVVESTPAAGEVLTAVPEQFSVTTNEAMLDLGGTGTGSAFGIEVRDAAGLYYGTGCVTVAGSTMWTDAELGEPGQYTLVYQFVSADGHPVSDSFTFEWAPVGDVRPSVGVAEASNCNGQYERGEFMEEAPDRKPIDTGIVLWIAGALAAVALVVLVTMLVRKPKKS